MLPLKLLEVFLQTSYDESINTESEHTINIKEKILWYIWRGIVMIVSMNIKDTEINLLVESIRSIFYAKIKKER